MGSRIVRFGPEPRPEAKRLKGELAKPILSHAWWMRALYGESNSEAIAYAEVDQELIDQQMEEKLLLLLDHFDIPRTDRGKWKALSLAMAQEFITGFKVIDSDQERPAGKPKAWTCDRFARLFVEVHEMVRAGRTARNACQILLRETRWQQPDCKSLDSLYRRYQASLKSPYVKNWLGAITDEDEWRKARDAVLGDIDPHGKRILAPKLARVFNRTTR